MFIISALEVIYNYPLLNLRNKNVNIGNIILF